MHKEMVKMTMLIDGFTYTDWYIMPVIQRKLYGKFAEEVFEEQREYIEKNT